MQPICTLAKLRGFGSLGVFARASQCAQRIQRVIQSFAFILCSVAVEKFPFTSKDAPIPLRRLFANSVLISLENGSSDESGLGKGPGVMVYSNSNKIEPAWTCSKYAPENAPAAVFAKNDGFVCGKLGRGWLFPPSPSGRRS